MQAVLLFAENVQDDVGEVRFFSKNVNVRTRSA